MGENKLNIEESLLDQSWKEMEGILNREMPVKKDRRWWLIAAFFSFFLLFSVFVANQEIGIPGGIVEIQAPKLLEENRDENLDQRIIENENQYRNAEIGDDKNEKTIYTNTRAHPSPGLNETIDSEAGNGNASVIARTKDVLKENQAPREIKKNEIVHSINQSIAINTSSRTGVSTKLLSSKEDGNPNIHELSNSGGETEKVMVWVTEALSTWRHISQLPSLDRKISEMTFGVKTIPAEQIIKKQNLFIDLSVISSNHQLLPGIEGGISFERAINENWSIGLIGNVNRLYFQNESIVDNNQGLSTPEADMEEQNAANLSQATIRIDSYESILESTTSIGLGAKVNKKWNRFSLGAGGYASYLLDAKNNVDVNSNKLSSSYYLDNDMLESWQSFLLFESRWEMNKRFQFVANYRFGLNDRFNNAHLNQRSTLSIRSDKAFKISTYSVGIRMALF